MFKIQYQMRARQESRSCNLKRQLFRSSHKKMSGASDFDKCPRRPLIRRAEIAQSLSVAAAAPPSGEIP
jgi:hypothetical protein